MSPVLASSPSAFVDYAANSFDFIPISPINSQILSSSSPTLVNSSQCSSYGEDFSTVFDSFERMNKQMLCELSTSHGIYFEKTTSVDTLKDFIIHHITSGHCTCSMHADHMVF